MKAADITALKHSLASSAGDMQYQMILQSLKGGADIDITKSDL